MELSYPSERFPGPPVIRLDIPEGWEAADSPTANITVFDTNSPDHFRVNLMVSVRRMQTEASISQVATRFAEETRGRYPDYEIVGERLASLNGHEAVIRAQRVTPLASPYPLFQAEVLLFGPGRGPTCRTSSRSTPPAPVTWPSTTARSSERWSSRSRSIARCTRTR